MKAICTLMLSVFIVFQLSAQEFEKKQEEGGIIFYGMWKDVKTSEPNPPLQLCIMTENSNDYAADLEFTVAFYEDGVEMETSKAISYCIKPGKKIKGRKYGLCLISEGIDNEKIKSDSFDWGLIDIEVKELKSCP